MNLKHLLVTGTLLITPFGEQANRLQDNPLDTHKEAVKSELSYVLVSSHIPKDSTASYTLGESISSVLSQDGEVIVRRPTKELVKTPFVMPKVARDFGAMLGYNQTDSILKNYNSSEQLYSFHRYQLLDTLNFPLIYPDLKQYFPNTISELSSLESFSSLSDSIDFSGSLLFVQQVDSGKHALGFYKNNQLIVSTYVSVGKGKKVTPTGKFSTKRKIANCWSDRRDAPMPYGIEFITRYYFFHQGHVNGEPLSHGCVRVPGLYQEVLYALVDDETQIVISPTLYKKHSLPETK